MLNLKKGSAFFMFILILTAMNVMSFAQDRSSVLEQDVPQALKVNQVYTMTIVMRNDGPNRWTKSDNYRLALYDNIDNMYQSDVWGVKSVALPYDVGPSEKATFMFNITAPPAIGKYNCRWSMAKDNEFFGETTTAALVDVMTGDAVIIIPSGSTDNNSVYISQIIPSEMKAGEKYKVFVTMKNTGKSVWVPTGDSYRLVLLSEGAEKVNYPDWTPPVTLARAVQPGETSTLEFFVTAPPNPGTYDLQWILQNGSNYFGQKTDKVMVKVLGANEILTTKDYNAMYMEQNVPDQMTKGIENNVSITMSNTGNKTWKVGEEKLVLTDANMLPISFNKWNVGYVSLTRDVAPGELVTFNFNVNPEETGWQHFQFIMMNGQGVTFGTATKPVEVLVSNKK